MIKDFLAFCFSVHFAVMAGDNFVDRPLSAKGFERFTSEPEFQTPLYETDPWDPKIPEITRDNTIRTKIENSPDILGKNENLLTSNSGLDDYDIHWKDNFSFSNTLPLASKSRKRKAKPERGIASIKPSSSKRIKNDFHTMGKENEPQAPVYPPYDKTAKNRILVPSKVFQYKGISEMNLLINGESIELHCGMPVVFSDFRDEVEDNLHVSPQRDRLGCQRVTSKPSPQNVENIMTLVKRKMHCPHLDFRDGSIYDDAVVFERVKQVAVALSGGMDLFMQRVYNQKPWEYLNNRVDYRDHFENWHYRYYTRHMWFEIQLLEVLRQYYPRHGVHNVPPATTSNSGHAAEQGTPSEDFNITDHLDPLTPRNNFQRALLDVLQKHLEDLPHPTRPTGKLDNHTNPLEGVVAHAMYSQTRSMDVANLNELFALVPKSLRKGFSRLQALHIVLHLAFRYSLHSRYLLFMEHNGVIPMRASERSSFFYNFRDIQGMLNAENKFTTTAPAKFGEMMRFIERSGCYLLHSKNMIRDQ